MHPIPHNEQPLPQLHSQIHYAEVFHIPQKEGFDGYILKLSRLNKTPAFL